MERKKIIGIWFFILITQSFYLLLFSKFFPENILGFIIIHSTCFIFLNLFKGERPGRIILDHQLSRIIFSICFISFGSKFFSRADEINAFLNYGYFVMRNTEGQATPMLLSVINILYYPLAITIMVSDSGRPIIRKFLYVSMMVMTIVDIVFLGTRNVPVFINLLIFVFRVDISKRAMLWGIFSVIIFLFLFSYTTSNRTQEAFDGVFDWAYLLKWTVSSQIVSPKIQLMKDFSNIFGDWIWPVLFLMQYISHSIAEFSYQLTNSDFTILPSFTYLLDQICVFGCSRDMDTEILLLNSRAGSYQTLLTSIFFDFGMLIPLVGFVLLVIVSLTLRSENRRIKMNWAVKIYIMYIFALAPIENYLYNGLGLIQNSITLFLLATATKELRI